MQLNASQAKMGQYLVVPVTLVGAVYCAIEEFGIGTIIFFLLFVIAQSILWWYKDRNPVYIKAFAFNAIGFTAQYNRQKFPVKWAHVNTIIASKQPQQKMRVDIFTGPHRFVFNPASTGWGTLLGSIEKQFPQSPKAWWVNVPFTLELSSSPFRVLYDSKNRAGEEVLNEWVEKAI
jgi:hypothetical protein